MQTPRLHPKEVAMSKSGFVKMPNWVMRVGVLNPYELAVYMVLKSHADKHGVCFPSRATIAKEAQVSDKTVKRTIDQLIERGFVRKTVRPNQGGKHDSNLYHVVTFSDADPNQGVSQTPSGGPTFRTQGVSQTHEEEPQEEEPQEEDLRSAQGVGHAPSLGTFIDPQEPATREQLHYLRDLHIHYFNEAPNPEQTEYWGDHTKQQATELIALYLKRMPRYDSYQGPEEGEDTYKMLSPKGQQYADLYMLPEAS